MAPHWADHLECDGPRSVREMRSRKAVTLARGLAWYRNKSRPETEQSSAAYQNEAIAISALCSSRRRHVTLNTGRMDNAVDLVRHARTVGRISGASEKSRPCASFSYFVGSVAALLEYPCIQSGFVAMFKPMIPRMKSTTTAVMIHIMRISFLSLF